MSIRSKAVDVKALLGFNYDHRRNPDLTPFIQSASLIVDQLVTDTPGQSWTAKLLELIERWLSAHVYTTMDPLYTSRSTMGSSGSMTRTGEDYKNMAIMLDPTRKLAGILDINTREVSMTWLGNDYVEGYPLR